MKNRLNRFTEAQETTYEKAFSEIRHGKKETHWMWFIFPQIRGLGNSETSKYYAIEDINEASEFLKDSILRGRLIKICHELLELQINDAHKIFGAPDDLKLKSCMTLFLSLKETNPVFKLVLDKFFNGEPDVKTLDLILKY
jgi:uncharacterized protein (DUF1810 family)